MPFHLAKYTALGNDMIVIDPAHCPVALTPENVRLICDRHFGVGADGICYGPLSGNAPFIMRFFNPDGSEAERSGNGLRIFARYLWDADYVTSPDFMMGMGADTIPTHIDPATGLITLVMGGLQILFADQPLKVGQETVLATAVTIGNPHCIIFTPELDRVHTWGPLIENAPPFPHRTNVQLVNVLDDHTIQIAIWERGAGYTLASGTSASAAAAAAVRTGRCASRQLTVQMAGGHLTVDVLADGVRLTGPVTAVYHATFSPDLLAQFAS
ncbi:MAG: diaminopimelate epimerase [Ardenticatenaceae bacterium]|nr:diaminopimelate epimerase [Ardenticatenaceae bacterium]